MSGFIVGLVSSLVSFASRWRSLAAAIVALACAVLVRATEPSRMRFDIAAGNAEETLRAFATQSGLEVLFSTEATKAIHTNAVRGELPPLEAVALLLSGTELKVVHDEKNSVLRVVRSKPSPPPAKKKGHTSTTGKPDSPASPGTEMNPKKMNPTKKITSLAGLLAVAFAQPVDAQTAAAPSAAKASEETIKLSPFEVASDNDNGYQATNTLGATRTNTPIRDLPMQINVLTEQLMTDRGIFDLDQALDLIPGAARVFNEFIPQVNIRGFDSSAAMRNGVRGLSTPDMTSVARVETIKGPAALLYGQSQPGGVINYITKNPSPRRSTNIRLSAGSDDLRRAELDTTGPVNQAKTLNYRLGIAAYSVDKGERQRSLDRLSFAPMVEWKPFSGTRLVLRYSNTHDDIRPAEGLPLKPTGALNRGGDASYFIPFLGLDPVRNPQWVRDLGPDFAKDSPSSFRDYRPVVWELEATQRLNAKMDLRANFAYHRRARSSVREGGTGLVNPWTQSGPTIASLGGYNSYNVDNTLGNPFPEATHTYGFYGRDGVSSDGIDPLSDTRLLDGARYVYNPGVATLAYTPGQSGWRRVNWIGNNRRETRVNGQVDLVTRFKLGPLDNTLLTGVEHNEDRVYENNSTFVRDRTLGVNGATLYTLPGTTTQVTNVVDYWYNVYSPASTAARDAYAKRNLTPLSGFATNGANNDQRFTSDAIYVNWSATFAQNRGRLAVGGRYDDVSARNSTKNSGIDPLTFGGVVTSSIEGARDRVTPQAGISYRVTEPISIYALYSQSVNPRVTFQPARTAANVQSLLDRYTRDGLPAPDLNSKPWGQLLEPEFGKSFEYGIKTDLFDNKVMINVAYYVIDKKNVSRTKDASDPDSSVSFVDLSGAERAKGVDIDFYARPIKELQIGGGMLFNDTEIVQVAPTTLATPNATSFTANTGPNAVYTLLGQRTTNAAKFSGNGYARYEFADGKLKGLGAGFGYTYIGARREGDNQRWSEAWGRWDLNASYRTRIFKQPTSFSFIVKNATSRFYRVDRDTFAQPRTFVGSCSIDL